MKTAAVSRLKASLSKYLSRVKSGEEVLVTDRGKPIAKIIPINRGQLEVSSHLQTLERSGLVRVGTGKVKANFWNKLRPRDKKGLALKYLLEEREEER